MITGSLVKPSFKDKEKKKTNVKVQPSVKMKSSIDCLTHFNSSLEKKTIELSINEK